MRAALAVSSAIAAIATLVLYLAPVAWLQELLGLQAEEAGAFLMRRYAASATTGLTVVVAAAMRGGTAEHGASLAIAAWFAAQSAVAFSAAAVGVGNSLMWAAAAGDLVIAAVFVQASRPARHPVRP